MKTNLKWQLPVLAAATLLAAGCDPFPAKPEGDPAVVRMTVYTAGATRTTTVDPVAGAVSTDMATPTDQAWIQFNKPLDGTSIELDTSGACVPAAGYNFSANWDPATPDMAYWAPPPPPDTLDPVPTKFCYYPSSATDGAQILIAPGAPLLYGEDYTVTGTVKDYQGKSVALDATVSVDGSEQLLAVDGYTARIFWFQARTPGAYTLEHSTDGGNTWSTLPTTVNTDASVRNSTVLYCDPFEYWINWYGDNTCRYYHMGLQPGSTNTYRLTEAGQSRPTATKNVKLGSGRSITLYQTVDSNNVAVPGVLKAKWSKVRGLAPADPARQSETFTQTYNLEWTTTDPAGTVTPTWTPVAVTAAASDPDCTVTGTTCGYLHTGLLSGTTYYYRVTPTYSPAIPGLKPGAVASKKAP